MYERSWTGSGTVRTQREMLSRIYRKSISRDRRRRPPKSTGDDAPRRSQICARSHNRRLYRARTARKRPVSASVPASAFSPTIPNIMTCKTHQARARRRADIALRATTSYVICLRCVSPGRCLRCATTKTTSIFRTRILVDRLSV